MFRPGSQLLTPENSTPNHHRVNIQPKIAKVKKSLELPPPSLASLMQPIWGDGKAVGTRNG